ncbi:MAG TPA: DUF6580 family putative transport protein [Candidatus Angelobacter sp.]|nr:DUF6580 family putative transport protein [Candidatus Angelobacter sp.]
MLAYLFVVIAVAIRVLAGTGTFATHGFTPVGASLLFFGSRMPRKQFWAPVLLLVASDLYLNFKVYGMGLTWDQTIIWAWYAGACFIGVLLHNRVKPLRVLGAGLGSAVSFFVVSNFGVWAAGYLYPRTWAGLLDCYTKALPFFRNGLASDLFFATVFFSIPVVVATVTQAEERSDVAT